MHKVILLSKEKNEDAYHYVLLIDADTKMQEMEYIYPAFERGKIMNKDIYR